MTNSQMPNRGVAERDALIVASGGGVGDPPDVSVIVPVTGAGALGTVLESLAAQTLPAARFEVVLVLVGDADTTEAGRFADRHPEIRLRACAVSNASAGVARNIGLRAARGAYSVFVEEGDQASPGLLEALLSRAKAGVVPVARHAETADPPPEDAGDLLLHALETPGGKLAQTRMARTVRYGDGLGSGMEFAYWLKLSEQEDLGFGLAAPDADACLTPTSPVVTVPGGDTDGFDETVLLRLALIRHLREVSPDSDMVRDLAERMVTRQAEGIRSFLLLHPDRHADVVSHARELAIVEMPWTVVNRSRARHLALLYLFTPFLDTSALVAARRLRERGWVTDVVSQDVSNLRTKDAASDLVAAEVVDQTRMLGGDLDIALWASVVTFTEHALAEVADLESENGAYDSVYSRAMAVHSHFAAAALKLRSPGIRWIAEFSDPLSMNALGEVRIGPVEHDRLTGELAAGLRRAGHAVPSGDASFYEWGEVLAYALADEIIFTNQHQLDFMLGYCSDRSLADRASAISRVSHHPVPNEDLYHVARSRYPLRPGKVHIGYFGNFYVNRGLTEITGALDALSAAERDRIQLHVFTSHPEPLVLQTLEQGLADVITVNPLLGFLKYLNLTTRFDVLLITDFATLPHYDPNPYLPAKLADYLGSGSRIWAVREPGSVLSTFEVDYESELGDVASATGVLRALAAPEGARSLASPQ